jgi:hypothetical protein
VTSIELKIEGLFSIKVDIDLWIVLALALLIAALFIIRYLLRRGKLSRTLEFDGSEIGIGPIRAKLTANIEDLRICYNLWVEMSTRKIGLPIDVEKDVISEVYDSWYSFFGIARDLIKSIPVSKLLRQDSTRKLVRLSIDVLNKGLRPHLTTWQAKYRKWYEEEINRPENAELSPQQVQGQFKEFADLVKDLLRVNEWLVAYKDKLGAFLE